MPRFASLLTVTICTALLVACGGGEDAEPDHGDDQQAEPPATQPAATQPAATAPAEDDGDAEHALHDRLGEQYGADEFHTVDKMVFTFNVEKGENVTRRSWQWDRETNEVTLTEYNADDTTKKPITFTHGDPDLTGEALAADKKFINDKFWLIPVIEIVRGEGVTITEQGEATAPVVGVKTTRYTASYADTAGGYTPGDRYDLFVDDGGRVLAWTFHRGGQDEPSLAVKWASQQHFGPLLICTEYVNADGSFRLFFTGVAVE